MTATPKSHANGALPRAWRFLQKPWDEKTRSVTCRWKLLSSQWNETLFNMGVPVRLPFGAWWVPRNDTLRDPLLAGTFETAEVAFVGRFLRSGMTVLDIGAHHGLYTLLASKRVGFNGRVVAFEPSPRERKALRLHLGLNLCWNVTVEEVALGNEESDANLYVVEGTQTGCNSLRPPVVVSGTIPVRVRVRRLDEWLYSHKIVRVDFIKLDVEGAELDALKGAERLLKRQPRPVILAEVQDVRTQPWGYRAQEIIDHLAQKEYKWFGLLPDGSIDELDLRSKEFEGNFVACPVESTTEIERLKNPVLARSNGRAKV